MKHVLLSFLMAVAFGLQTVSDHARSSSQWGTYKPNLFFALKEKSEVHNVVGLAWIVKDWRTDSLIVRHVYQFAQPYENVNAFYTAHDGESFARETIIDEEYNTKFLLDWIEEPGENHVTEWRLTLTVNALDPERQVKAIPFLYVSKPPGVEGGVPYQMSVDK